MDIPSLLGTDIQPRKMPKFYKRFDVGQFMKAKRQAAKEKASVLSEIKVEQQKIRRLNAKVFCGTINKR